MKKVYTSAVVIIPPEEIWEPIQEIRRKHDQQINRWMPHITFIYPFRPRSLFLSLDEQFKTACNQVEKFNISLTTFQYFEHKRDSFTFWLNPEPNKMIVNLQKLLLKLIPDCNDVNKFKNGFTPHLSVGQVLGRKNLKDLLFQVKRDWQELTFLVDHIHFIWREENKSSSFQIGKTYHLKSS